MSLEIAQLTLERVTLEIRYTDAFLLWDRAGYIWSRIRDMGDQLEMSKVEPNTIHGILDQRYIVAIEMQKAFIIDHNPERSLEQLRTKSQRLLEIVASSLEIEELSRVGARFIYFKEFETSNEAAEEVLSPTSFKDSSGSYMDLDFNATYADYAIKNEGESSGYRIQVRSITQNVEQAVPFTQSWAKLESIEKQRHVLVFDVDYYTLQPVAVDQFSADEWLAHVVHMINRDGNFFLRGKR